MRITLREWQKRLKSRDSLLYNCSEVTGGDGWVSFPIGMGYPFMNYSLPLETAQIGNHNRTVLSAFSAGTDKHRRPTGVNRAAIAATLQKNGIPTVRLPSMIYFRALPDYKFVVSPEGNGVDCHRHYEALMAGCIPVIEEHAGIREKYGECPILYTSDYSEITETYLEAKYEEMLDSVWDFSKLLLESYSEEEQREIKRNGNFWGNKLTRRLWYM
jgi:hypothetical protein